LHVKSQVELSGFQPANLDAKLLNLPLNHPHAVPHAKVRVLSPVLPVPLSVARSPERLLPR